jgi:hypothetical protein
VRRPARSIYHSLEGLNAFSYILARSRTFLVCPALLIFGDDGTDAYPPPPSVISTTPRTPSRGAHIARRSRRSPSRSASHHTTLIFSTAAVSPSILTRTIHFLASRLPPKFRSDQRRKPEKVWDELAQFCVARSGVISFSITVRRRGCLVQQDGGGPNRSPFLLATRRLKVRSPPAVAAFQLDEMLPLCPERHGAWLGLGVGGIYLRCRSRTHFGDVEGHRSAGGQFAVLGSEPLK